MMRINRCICTGAVAVLAAALLALPGCTDKNSDNGEEDVLTELVEEIVEETPADDPIEEPIVDLVEEEPGCMYPGEPYSFNSLGSTAGPADWPTSIKGGTEIYDLEHADFEAFFCDDTVQSIIVFFATTT